jgi:hypothetical protein
MLCCKLYRKLRAATYSRLLTRSQAFSSILGIEQPRFQTYDWLTIPFRYNPKNNFDCLIDLLLSIPPAYVRECRRNTTYSLQDHCGPLCDGIQSFATMLLVRLQDWWQTFQREHMQDILKNGDVLDFEHGGPLELEMSGVFANLVHSNHANVILNDSFLGTTLSIYCAIVLIAHSLLGFALTLQQPPVLLSNVQHHWQQRESHAESILTIGIYQQLKYPLRGDALRTGFPLQVVVVLGPTSRQRNLARDSLHKWGSIMGPNLWS